LFRGQHEAVSVDLEGNGWEGIDDITVGEDTFSGSVNLSTQFGVEVIDLLLWSNEERSSTVQNGFALSSSTPSQAGGSENNVVHIKFPVGLRGQRGIFEVSSVERAVNTTENKSTSVRSSWVVGEPEGEDRAADEFLVQNVVPDRGDVVNRDGFKSHAEKTVEFSDDESNSGLLGGLSEGLALNLKVGNAKDVSAQEARERAAAVSDGEFRSVCLIGGRFGRVVFVMCFASKIEGTAFGGWDPQVGRASVEDDSELLWRSTKSDGSIVLGILEVS
jgi:hypothetical protein